MFDSIEKSSAFVRFGRAKLARAQMYYLDTTAIAQFVATAGHCWARRQARLSLSGEVCVLGHMLLRACLPR